MARQRKQRLVNGVQHGHFGDDNLDVTRGDLVVYPCARDDAVYDDPTRPSHPRPASLFVSSSETIWHKPVWSRTSANTSLHVALLVHPPRASARADVRRPGVRAVQRAGRRRSGRTPLTDQASAADDSNASTALAVTTPRVQPSFWASRSRARARRRTHPASVLGARLAVGGSPRRSPWWSSLCEAARTRRRLVGRGGGADGFRRHGWTRLRTFDETGPSTRVCVRSNPRACGWGCRAVDVIYRAMRFDETLW